MFGCRGRPGSGGRKPRNARKLLSQFPLYLEAQFVGGILLLHKHEAAQGQLRSTFTSCLDALLCRKVGKKSANEVFGVHPNFMVVEWGAEVSQ